MPLAVGGAAFFSCVLVCKRSRTGPFGHQFDSPPVQTHSGPAVIGYEPQYVSAVFPNATASSLFVPRVGQAHY